MDKDDKEVKEVPRIQVKKTVSREDVEADDFQEKEILGPTRKLHEILYKYPPINLLNATRMAERAFVLYKNIALEGAGNWRRRSGVLGWKQRL